MINRNNIIELLKGIKVEWKALGQVTTTVTAPSKIKKDKYCKTGKIAIIDQGEQFIAGYSNEDIQPIEYGQYIIFGDHSEHIKYVDFSFIQGADGIKILKANIDNAKYIYYAFKNFYNKEFSYKRHWSNAKETYIPIPPLRVQTEIVRILDTFTKLTAELTAELIARKKQYNYYRDKLLTFKEDEVEWKALGEVGQLIRGNGLQKKDFTETGVPAIHYGQIYTYYGIFATETKSFVSAKLAEKLKKARYGDILLAGTSENVKDVMTPLGWLGGEIVFSGDMFAFRPSNILNTKYLTYLLQTTPFQKFKEKYANGTKVIRIPAEKFLTFNIPIPPLKEQTRIVEILDKFDALTNSITEGLPREIELRQKQYEYYRNLLLNFPKLEDK
jgi:type I restriction enzyme, S subunit